MFGCFISLSLITSENLSFSDVFRGYRNGSFQKICNVLGSDVKKNLNLFIWKLKFLSWIETRNDLVIRILLLRLLAILRPKNISYGKFVLRQKLLNFAPSDKDFVRKNFALQKVLTCQRLKQLSTFLQNLSFNERIRSDDVPVVHKRHIFPRKI